MQKGEELTVVWTHHGISNEKDWPAEADKIVVSISSVELGRETSWVSAFVRELSLYAASERSECVSVAIP